MHDAGRDTGERIKRSLRWSEKQSQRPNAEGYSQLHGDGLSLRSAEGFTYSGHLHALETRFTIERR
jgi:hypothetical protein